MAYIVPAVTLGGVENEKWNQFQVDQSRPVTEAEAVAFGKPSGTIWPATLCTPCRETLTVVVPPMAKLRSTPLKGPVMPAVNVWAWSEPPVLVPPVSAD
jgi:hypothetical protein